jgi:translation elongation factor EF-1alpha
VFLFTEERFEEVKTKLTPFLKSCGYNTKKDVTYLPVSGLHGNGIKVSVLQRFLSAQLAPFALC